MLISLEVNFIIYLIIQSLCTLYGALEIPNKSYDYRFYIRLIIFLTEI